MTIAMNKDSMAFVVYMIHRCANQWNLSPAKVYQKLKESGCIQSYLVPHYAVLHTQSSAYVLEDIEQYLKRRGIAVQVGSQMASSEKFNECSPKP